MRVSLVFALVAGLALGGCGLFGGEDEAAAPQVPAVPAEVNVQAVQRLEVGRTTGGLMIAAFGTAPGLGYSRPRLVPRREGATAPDGMLDYDFVVTPPPVGVDLPAGTARARSVRADVELGAERLGEVRGVRVHAVRGGVQMLF